MCLTGSEMDWFFSHLRGSKRVILGQKDYGTLWNDKCKRWGWGVNLVRFRDSLYSAMESVISFHNFFDLEMA